MTDRSPSPNKPQAPAPDHGLTLRWAPLPFWTPEEGVALCFALDPKMTVRGHIGGPQEVIADEPVRRFALLARKEVGAGVLQERMQPQAFLAWADSIGLKFHTKWREVLESAEKWRSERPVPRKLSRNERRTELIYNWASSPSWTVDEGVALSLTISPRLVRSGRLPLENSQAEEFERRRKHIIRACDQYYAYWRPSPDEFIRRAESVDIRFNLDWHAAVSDTPSPQQPAPSRGEDEKPFGIRERTTLLKLVIGMAVAGYKYDQNKRRNEATGEIADDLKLLGISLDRDTILKYLREGTDLLPRDAMDE